jgi:hypothetical protein
MVANHCVLAPPLVMYAAAQMALERMRDHAGWSDAGAKSMANELVWISISARRPHDREMVYARVKSGMPKKVTFYAQPSPRWEGSSIVYDFQYFAEWAALDRNHRVLRSLPRQRRGPLPNAVDRGSAKSA